MTRNYAKHIYNGHSSFFLAPATELFVVVWTDENGMSRRVRIRGKANADAMASERKGHVQPYGTEGE